MRCITPNGRTVTKLLDKDEEGSGRGPFEAVTESTWWEEYQEKSVTIPGLATEI
jgi:hypothetical protein